MNIILDNLPLVFVALMGISMLMYGLLDGYDLGVGILSILPSNRSQKDKMISSIGPFWDANETWLVLGVGILLVAFPKAHGVILGHLYIPIFFMLAGLIFRGVAFDFRAKSKPQIQHLWDYAFFGGSLVTSLSQGYMLGLYITGFNEAILSMIFSFLISICLTIAYILIGANWLILKTEGELQLLAIKWARYSLIGAVLCVALVSIGTPATNYYIFEKWFSMPAFLYLSPIPFITGLLILLMGYLLFLKLPFHEDRFAWLPFVLTVIISILCFIGLAYSFFPYIIPTKMTIYQAASSKSSLVILLIGASISLPALFGYTFLAYKIFSGKVDKLSYD